MKTSGTQIEIENRLREKRQALALSQKQLADLAGITRKPSLRWRPTNISPPPRSPSNLRALCAVG